MVRTHEDAVKALQEFVNGDTPPAVVVGRVTESKGLVWVFSGHGAQWPQMGQKLLENSAFHGMVASLDSIVKEESGFSALDALEKGYLGGSAKIQVLTYIVQGGLSGVLR